MERNIKPQKVKKEIEKPLRGSGFYYLNIDKLVYAPNKVIAKNFNLLKENKDEYTYPINGWHWFEDEDSANKYFGI